MKRLLLTYAFACTLLAAAAQRPLCIVNGKPYAGDPLREIAPADIESMEQLPADERTIALYGDRASDGVLLITLRYDTEARFTADSISFRNYIERRIAWGPDDPTARVVFRYRVLEDGSVELTDLLESTDGRLKRKVVKAVGEAPRWEPALKNGQPVVTEHVLRIQLPQGRPMPPERAVIIR